MPRTTGPANASRAATIAAVLAVLGCQKISVVETPPQPGDQAVARVNGKAVWASDVKREAVAQGLIGQGEPLDVSSDPFREVLDEVVDQKLLAAEAVKRGMDRDVAAQRRLAAARERILGDILMESAVGRQVNDAAVNGLYQEMLTNAAPTEQIELHQVVAGTEAEAQQVRSLLAGGASFDAVAAQRSRDEATRFKGGLLGPVSTDLLPPAYAPALKAAKPGELAGPFKTDQGWVVARVDDRRREPPITLAAARPQIIRFLTYDQVKDLILNLRRKAKVETLIGPPQDVPGAPREPASAPAAVTPPAATAPPGAKAKP